MARKRGDASWFDASQLSIHTSATDFPKYRFSEVAVLHHSPLFRMQKGGCIFRRLWYHNIKSTENHQSLPSQFVILKVICARDSEVCLGDTSFTTTQIVHNTKFLR